MGRRVRSRPPRAGRVVLAAIAVWLLTSAALLSTPATSLGGDGSGSVGKSGPELDASAWILVDARDGDRLTARSPAQRRSIASTTKLMTAYLALRGLRLDAKLTVPAYQAAPAESVAGLMEGERLTVRDLLTAMMLPSANDAAETVALGLARSEAAFVERMNSAARDLGLQGTHYANPIGLDDPGNYSTAADLATLALKLREDKRFRRIVEQPEATLSSGSVERLVVTHNTLLHSDPSVDGIKTGHTLAAGYVLVASAKRKGVPLVSVVLGTPSEAERDAASEQLLDYGYSLYEQRSPFRADEPLASVEVRYEDQPLELLAKRPLEVSVRDDQDLRAAVDAPEELEGPLKRGEELGTATVILDGEKVGKVPLVAARAVAEPGLVDKLGGPPVLAAIIMAAIVILVLTLLARRHSRHGEREGERSPEERMRSRHDRTRRREDGGGPE